MCRILEVFILGLVLLEILAGSTGRTTEWPEITSKETTTKKSTTTSTTTSTTPIPSTTDIPPTTPTTPNPPTSPTTPIPSTTSIPSTTPNPPTTPIPPPTPTSPIQPQCPLVSCLRDSPSVCGRLKANQCQRFSSVCDMLNQSRLSNISVVATRDMYCLGLKGTDRGPCYIQCPQNPRHLFPCRPTPQSEEICVRSRDGRRCKMLANMCQLREQNCFSKPRKTWHPTFKRNCGKRLVGDKPDVCLKRPIAPIGEVIN